MGLLISVLIIVGIICRLIVYKIAEIGRLLKIYPVTFQFQCNFSPISLLLPVSSLLRINRQIQLGINVCHMRKKFDSARDPVIRNKLSPEELFIKKTSFIFF